MVGQTAAQTGALRGSHEPIQLTEATEPTLARARSACQPDDPELFGRESLRLDVSALVTCFVSGCSGNPVGLAPV